MNATKPNGCKTQRGKRAAQYTRASKPAIGPADALQMVESAIRYCKDAGMKIRAGNAPNLVLSIDGAKLETSEGGEARFVLADVTALDNAPTTPSAEPLCPQCGKATYGPAGDCKAHQLPPGAKAS